MKILICDDAGFVREILRQALTELGHVVVGEARDGAEVIEQARALQPDAILMDLVLPLKNGAEASQEIREAVPSAKIVILSTVEPAFLEAKAREVGCDACLAKPFSKASLKAVLEKLGGNKNREARSG